MQRRWKVSTTRMMSIALACLLALETMPAPVGAQEQPKPRLNIVIVEGEGAINNIRQRTAREPIVQVEDENHKPVAGAAVVFLLPQSGASGVFPNGSNMLSVITDQQGRAVARGLRPNNVAGKYQIRVSASHQGMTANATITQTNVLGAAAAVAGVSVKLIIILAAAAGAAAVGAVAATRGGGTSATTGGTPPPSAIVISPGSPSVGSPR